MLPDDGTSGDVVIGDVEAESRRYTPDEIDLNLCLARIWNNGKGGQCGRPPHGAGDFCSTHIKQLESNKGLSHGRVDGLVPMAKLREFWKAVGQFGTEAPPPAPSVPALPPMVVPRRHAERVETDRPVRMAAWPSVASGDARRAQAPPVPKDKGSDDDPLVPLRSRSRRQTHISDVEARSRSSDDEASSVRKRSRVPDDDAPPVPYRQPRARHEVPAASQPTTEDVCSAEVMKKSKGIDEEPLKAGLLDEPPKEEFSTNEAQCLTVDGRAVASAGHWCISDIWDAALPRGRIPRLRCRMADGCGEHLEEALASTALASLQRAAPKVWDYSRCPRAREVCMTSDAVRLIRDGVMQWFWSFLEELQALSLHRVCLLDGTDALSQSEVSLRCHRVYDFSLQAALLAKDDSSEEATARRNDGRNVTEEAEQVWRDKLDRGQRLQRICPADLRGALEATRAVRSVSLNSSVSRKMPSASRQWCMRLLMQETLHAGAFART